MKSNHRKLAAIMFTDLVGYSALSHRDEKLALELLEEHRRLIRPVLTAHAGHEIKTIGDAFLVEFDSALDAIECACQLQKASSERNAHADSGRALQMRIGIHLGDVVVTEDDVFGDGVNIASRLQSKADAGGICFSQQVYDQVMGKVSCQILAMGDQHLKNINTPVRTYAIPPIGTLAASPVKHGVHGRRTLLAIIAAVALASVALTAAFLPAVQRLLGGSGKKHVRLAVLPFANISPSAEDEYLSDGMTDEIISNLIKVPGLHVMARTSVMHYKKMRMSIADIGRELNVPFILEGSLRKAQDRIRIDLKLINTANEEAIWSREYETGIKNIFETQREIARAVAAETTVRFVPTEDMKLSPRAIPNRDAYLFYLKAIYYKNRRTEEGLRKAIDYLKSTELAAPNFAPVYAELANCYSLLAFYGFVSPEASLPLARMLAEKSIKLDPRLAQAHVALAQTLAYYYRDWAAAENEFQKAISVDDDNATAHHWLAELLVVEHRFDEARAQAQKALELDPMSFMIKIAQAHPDFVQGNYDQAIKRYREVLKTDSGFVPGQIWLGRALLEQKSFEQALEAFTQATKLDPANIWAKAELAKALAATNHSKEAKVHLRELTEAARARYIPSSEIAAIHARLGDNDQALKYLAKSLEEHSNHLAFIRDDPSFSGLRADPRFQRILAEIGFKP